MKFISLKWKLSAAVMGVALCLVGLYVFIAKQTFESDKISYVFDTQQAQLDSAARDLRQRFTEALFLSRSILSTYDFQTKALTPACQTLFKSQDIVKAIELSEPEVKTPFLTIEQSAGLLKSFPDMIPSATGRPVVQAEGDDVMVLSQEKGGDGTITWLKLVIELKNPLPSNGSFGIIQSARVLKSSTRYSTGANVFREIASEVSRDRAESTSIKKINGESYLVSTADVDWGDLKLVSFVSENDALGALQVLFHRSIVFIAFSVFATILISLLLSSGLTRNLNRLTENASAIGQGRFNASEPVVSNDEIGVLSTAFQKMGTEIERLLLETRDKARMEEELKTASLVQESLFPKQSHFELNGVSLSGFYLTSTECGGDWWYYFQRGDDIYLLVADATGHGTPAALITSAARSLFSKIERSDDSLLQIARDWDQAVAASSGQKVFMTAFMIKINTRSGQGVFLNACHEPPLLLQADEDGYRASYLDILKGTTLGELKPELFYEQNFTLEPGARLVLFTDGLFAIENEQGQTLSDNRFAKAMTKRAQSGQSAREMAEGIKDIIAQQRGGRDLPDDVTVAVLARNF